MAAFKSGWDFILFEEAVRTKYRYIHSAQVREFLETLVATSASRIKILPNRSPLWRAQQGCAIENVERRIDDPDIDLLILETEVSHPSARMKPERSGAREGRVNPKGIPCLYVATERDTAMAEVRPWLGAKISVGHFETIRELRVVDFSVHHDTPLIPGMLGTKLSPAEVIDGIWSFVDKAFSKPVGENLSSADYAPTQIIAEIFRQQGFDGIYYKSSLGRGCNIALFDLDAAELVDSSLFTAAAVEYAFEKA